MRLGVAGVGRIGVFHASTLAALDAVEQVVVCDAVPAVAETVAGRHGYAVADDLDALLDEVDGLVVTTPTSAHAEALRAAVAAQVPTFCEKPVATTVEETVELAKLVDAAQVPVHVGFQRRFDQGYLRAREAVRGGELGFVHTIRANTHDQSPPAPEFLPTSGGLFRDCSVHDFDAIRFVTGREVVRAFGVGANKGEPFFTEHGDVDTCAAVLTLDDDTIALVSATRYNGGGHDVRLEVMGSAGAVGVGYDDSLALRSAEAGVEWPRGPQRWSFMERFEAAYRAELSAFCDVVAGRTTSPCTVADALAAFRVAEACDRSLHTGRPVELSEIGGAP